MFISKYKSIGYAVLAFFLIMAFWNGITGWMYEKNAWLIECENKIWLCVLLGVCCVAILVHIIYTIRHSLHFQTRVTYWSYLILAAIVYVRLRLDGHFDFYNIVGKIAWTDIIAFLLFFDRILIQVSSKSKKKKCINGNDIDEIQQEADNAERIKQDIQIILDKPIKDEKDDLMKYCQIAAHIYNNLMLTDVSEKALSVGIIGDWGQGKSSMLNFLKSNIEKRKGNIIVEFNPRNSLNSPAIQSDFFELFSSKIAGGARQIRVELAKYVKAVLSSNDSWIASLLCAIFPTDEVSREDINKLIMDSGLSIFVVIDDFDRLTAKEIIEVLKLIDCNANFVNTYFITAFDKSYVDEVMQNYLHTSKSNFSDKYFDYEYYLPVVNQSNLLNYMNLVLEQLQLKGYEVSELMKVWSEYGVDICNQLGTLRNLKRFLNLFFGRYFMINEEVDAHDFLYVTLLRYNDINAYNALLDNSLIHKGRSHPMTSNNDVEENPDLYYINENLQDIIKANSFGEFTEKIIRELFPIKRNAPADEKDYYQRIQSIIFFDRYFYDFQSLLLNQRDLHKMIEAENDDEATNILKTISESNQIDVKLYLIKELQDFAKTGNSFSRLVSLSFAYIANFPGDLDFIFHITDLFEIPILSRLIHNKQFKTREDYRLYWDKEIKVIGNNYPYELSHVLRLVYNTQNQVDLVALFNNKELHELILNLQKRTLKIAAAKDNFDDAFMASQIYELPKDRSLTPKDGAHYDEQAVNVLLDSMYKYPHSYFRFVVRMQAGGGQLQIWLDNALVEIMNQYPKKLINWIDYNDDNTEKDIIKWLNEEERKQRVVEYDNRENPSKEDLYELLKFSYNEEDETFVRKALEDEHSYDIEHIKKWLIVNYKKSLHDSIHNILTRLYEKKVEKEWAIKIKDKIEPFKPNDLVKIDKEKSKILKIESNTIWKVTTVTGDTYHLEGLSEPIHRNYLLPIPIGGIYDKNIYYDSVQAGSVIGSNDPKPVHHIEHRYYMDQFKNDRIISALISNHNCQFVHEVQHVLRDKGFDGQLKVKPSQTWRVK